jgi:hypothetical protein
MSHPGKKAFIDRIRPYLFGNQFRIRLDEVQLFQGLPGYLQDRRKQEAVGRMTSLLSGLLQRKLIGGN